MDGVTAEFLSTARLVLPAHNRVVEPVKPVFSRNVTAAVGIKLECCIVTGCVPCVDEFIASTILHDPSCWDADDHIVDEWCPNATVSDEV